MIAGKTICIVGLGYVGLPLALAFGKHIKTIGFDVSESKIAFYKSAIDPTGEVDAKAFKDSVNSTFTTDERRIGDADFIVVAVPTPADGVNPPDLSYVEKATAAVGRNMKAGAIVIYESTVYPGVTDDICAPILEKESKMRRGSGFKLGYSPERINPGDKNHSLENVVKIVSGEDQETLNTIASLYSLVVRAGVYKAPSIKIAEAAKVIENIQRDINIALMNELSIIFHRIGIDTVDVLEAAGTKWNFLPFRPGYVGGHCISQDPYYLSYKSKSLGYYPHIILAGRRINNGMGKYIAEQTVKRMIEFNRNIKGGRVLVLGITFKENCKDLRNSKVYDTIKELESYGIEVSVYDPVADPEEVTREYGINAVSLDTVKNIEAVIAAVSHKEIININLCELRKRAIGIIPFIDVKSCFDREKLGSLGFDVWRL